MNVFRLIWKEKKILSIFLIFPRYLDVFVKGICLGSEVEEKKMVEVKSFRKATIPTNLLSNPSPGNIQSTRLDLHVRFVPLFFCPMSTENSLLSFRFLEMVLHVQFTLRLDPVSIKLRWEFAYTITIQSRYFYVI